MKKKHIFFLLLFLSFYVQSQHNFNNLIVLDTIGASPIELPRYANRHNIKRMIKVRLKQDNRQSVVLGDGRDINIGRQKGMIEDIKEYDWRGNITLDVEYSALGPYDNPYEYVYDDKDRRKILESADKSGAYQTGLKRYFYNEKNQLDSIQLIILYVHENDSSYHYKGTNFFDYDDLGRLEQITFLYQKLRSNLIDTIGRTIYEYTEDTCNIIKYHDHSSSFDIYKLVYNNLGQVIEQQNEYSTEKYEYNAAGWISKKTSYKKNGEQGLIIDYFYDENYLLIGSEHYSNPEYKTEILYIYEFY